MFFCYCFRRFSWTTYGYFSLFINIILKIHSKNSEILIKIQFRKVCWWHVCFENSSKQFTWTTFGPSKIIFVAPRARKRGRSWLRKFFFFIYLFNPSRHAVARASQHEAEIKLCGDMEIILTSKLSKILIATWILSKRDF